MGSLNSHTKFHKNELGNHVENWNRKDNQTDTHNLKIGFQWKTTLAQCSHFELEFYLLFISCYHNASFSTVINKLKNQSNTRKIQDDFHLVVSCYLCCSVVFSMLFVLFYVLFVCKCVLYYCHRVATELQLINISYCVDSFT